MTTRDLKIGTIALLLGSVLGFGGLGLAVGALWTRADAKTVHAVSENNVVSEIVSSMDGLPVVHLPEGQKFVGFIPPSGHPYYLPMKFLTTPDLTGGVALPIIVWSESDPSSRKPGDKGGSRMVADFYIQQHLRPLR